MALYKEDFPVGSKVRVVDRGKLEEFLQQWRYHHKLEPEQLEYADSVAEVEKVEFYHGGDVLYKLRGVPGIWHEQCLASCSYLHRASPPGRRMAARTIVV